VKTTTLCLGLLVLAGAGCTTPDGAPLPRPPAVEIAERPAPVRPEEVNEVNAREMLRKLEKEIRFDERQVRTAPAEKETP
jgi:hypothetical protein